jgi:hypothetical protein
VTTGTCTSGRRFVAVYSATERGVDELQIQDSISFHQITNTYTHEHTHTHTHTHNARAVNDSSCFAYHRYPRGAETTKNPHLSSTNFSSLGPMTSIAGSRSSPADLSFDAAAVADGVSAFD